MDFSIWRIVRHPGHSVIVGRVFGLPSKSTFLVGLYHCAKFGWKSGIGAVFSATWKF